MDELLLIIVIVFIFLIWKHVSQKNENLENIKPESNCEELCINNETCNNNCDTITQQEKDALRYAKLIFG